MRLPAHLSQRRRNAYKGDFGHVLVLAGSAGLTGAAALCAHAALRSGSGLVTLGIPKSLNAIMETKLTEVMTKPLSETPEMTLAPAALGELAGLLEKADVVLIGPGLSQHPATQEFVRGVVTSIERPLVIDADGLNAMAGHTDSLKKTSTIKIITPHPGELARLLGITVETVQKDREAIAVTFAQKHNCIVVLKGRTTVVAQSDGRMYRNTTGNPGMATAGSGDVLTGIIGSFLGQGLSAFDAAKYGSYIHGLAGDMAAKEKGEIGLIASDILEALPKALLKAR